MQGPVLLVAAIGLLGLTAAFGGASQDVDGTKGDSETTVVRVSGAHSLGSPVLRGRKAQPLTLPEVVPPSPGPVPMPEVESADPPYDQWRGGQLP